MTLEEGLKLKPTFSVPYHYGKIGVEIPQVGRDDFAKFLFDRGYRVGVEVGVFDGKYGVTLCKAGLKMYGVDPYVSYDEYKGEVHERHYEEAIKNLKSDDYKSHRFGDVITPVNTYVQAHGIETLNIMANDDYPVPNWWFVKQ